MAGTSNMMPKHGTGPIESHHIMIIHLSQPSVLPFSGGCCSLKSSVIKTSVESLNHMKSMAVGIPKYPHFQLLELCSEDPICCQTLRSARMRKKHMQLFFHMETASPCSSA